MSFDVLPLNEVAKHLSNFVNVAGFVVDYRAPMATNGTDCMCTFNICDHTRALKSTSFMIRVFHPDESKLPEAPGDFGDDTCIIAFFREIKVMNFNGDEVGVSHKTRTKWAIYAVTSLKPKKPKKNILAKHKVEMLNEHGTFSDQDKKRMEELCEDLFGTWKGRGGTASAHGVSRDFYQNEIQPAERKKKKFSLIRDIQQDSFYDIIGYVIRTYPNSEKQFTMYITDYTKNELLYDPDSKAGPGGADYNETLEYARTGGGVTTSKPNKKTTNGPGGKYTLQLAVWDTSARVAQQNVREGMYVMVSNMRCKLASNGLLEGAIHGDRMYPDKRFINVLDKADPRLKELLSRKRKFEREEEQQKKIEEEEAKRRKEEEAKRLTEQELERRAKVNPHVITGYPSVVTTEISNIIQLHRGVLPYQNMKYRVRARVVDFLPHNLAAFCVKNVSYSTQYDIEQTPADSADLCDDAMVIDTGSESWAWNFQLKVCGLDGQEMLIRVQGDDATKFLGLEPCDLQNNKQTLQRLQQILFLLWGDLEEQKQNQLTSLLALEERRKNLEIMSRKKEGDLEAVHQEIIKLDKKLTALVNLGGNEESNCFECLVKEVGINVGGEWQQFFLLFGTTIKGPDPFRDSKLNNSDSSSCE